MASGFVVIVRDIENKGIYVETTDDWQEYIEERPRRLLYCQCISDVDTVQEEIDKMVFEPQSSDISEMVAELISAVQWIANDHPLTTFLPVEENSD